MCLSCVSIKTAHHIITCTEQIPPKCTVCVECTRQLFVVVVWAETFSYVQHTIYGIQYGIRYGISYTDGISI
jgi:hypothetical protein